MRSKIIYWSITLTLVFISLFFDLKILYLLFALQAGIIIAKNREFSIKVLWEITVWSLILPDNYTCVFLILVTGIATLVTSRKNDRMSKSYVWILLILLGFTAMTTVVNKVPVENLIMGALYFSTLIIAAFLINCNGIYERMDAIAPQLDAFLNVELFATLLKIIFHFAGRVGGSDWSTGTFGRVQQTQLFMVAFLGIFWDIAYRKKKDKKATLISWRTAAFFIGCFSTNCWALFVVCIVGVLLTMLLNMKARYSIPIVIFVALAAVALERGNVLPESVKNQINLAMTDEKFRERRFAKVVTYEDTFLEIPKKDKQFMLIGNGFGNYASRAALTCTGKYIKSYTKIFNVRMSKYTKEYILPGLTKAFLHGETNYGSVIARPYSTWLALMGEIGYIGIVMFLFTVGYVIRKTDKFSKMAIVGILFSCILENFLEYSRIVLVLMFVIIICNNKFSLKKEDISCEE